MANFLLTYSGGDGSMPDDPAEVEAVMAKWGAWYGSLGAALVDGGAPLGERKTVGPDGAVEHGGSALTGYTVITADSIDAAVEASKGCPILEYGSVHVHQAIEM